MTTPPPPGPPYPQQPQQPQYGQPQYGQPPYGQQPGAPWGMPQTAPQMGPPMGPLMGPPPRKKGLGSGAIVAIVLGSLLVVSVAVWGVVQLVAPFARSSYGPRYTLTVPRTLDGGAYSLDKDISESVDREVGNPGPGANEHGITGVGGQYSDGDKRLVYTGLYGTINSPELAVDHSISGMTEDGNTEVPVDEREFLPEGTDEPVTCGVAVAHDGGTDTTMPFCVWADRSHQANLIETDSAHPDADPTSFDLRAFADRAGRVRDEVRVEAD
ncbi:hypothetical protein [Streptomyces niger]|uniref:hypothetical protein n=1 Tax=Streptomyces niger TaxID=66373 RepID=UPI0018FE25B8|nr:hypothetical protein [Streptomyces niger]